jgi:hypothetical protein
MLRSALASAVVVAAVVACGGAVSPDASSSSSSSSGASSGDSSHGCTGIGCVDGLVVSFGPGTEWTPGTYVFSLDADGVQQTCKGALPLPPCASGRALSCTGDVATIGESGCALPAAQHRFADIQLRSGPSKVKLHIERDGVVLADETLVPAYRTSQPNGPNCGPVCRQASAVVNLTAR